MLFLRNLKLVINNFKYSFNSHHYAKIGVLVVFHQSVIILKYVLIGVIISATSKYTVIRRILERIGYRIKFTLYHLILF